MVFAADTCCGSTLTESLTVLTGDYFTTGPLAAFILAFLAFFMLSLLSADRRHTSTASRDNKSQHDDALTDLSTHFHTIIQLHISWYFFTHLHIWLDTCRCVQRLWWIFPTLCAHGSSFIARCFLLLSAACEFKQRWQTPFSAALQVWPSSVVA